MTQWELSQECENTLSAARDILQAEYDELSREYDVADESWKESEKGEAIGAWLDNIDEFLDTLKKDHTKPEV